jgi:DNA-binding protein H-NS
MQKSSRLRRCFWYLLFFLHIYTHLYFLSHKNVFLERHRGIFMTERRNETMVEWLDIKLDTLSPDERMRLVEEIYDTLTAQELMSMRQIAEEKRKGKLDEAKNLVLDEMRGKFEELGLDLEDIFPSRRPRKAKSTLPVKYRSPDGLHTWSGRGFAPIWMRELEEQGHEREEYKVE